MVIYILTHQPSHPLYQSNQLQSPYPKAYTSFNPIAYNEINPQGLAILPPNHLLQLQSHHNPYDNLIIIIITMKDDDLQNYLQLQMNSNEIVIGRFIRVDYDYWPRNRFKSTLGSLYHDPIAPRKRLFEPEEEKRVRETEKRKRKTELWKYE